MERLAIVGCGRLGRIVAEAVAKGILPEYELVGTYSRTFKKAAVLAAGAPGDCRACRTLEELFSLNPDYIVEAASPAAMRELALPALERGIS
ncbi:MAG: aspartate dehydrogenase, partial [Bacteroidales bacterium]|nr:aspartate dehydrogenase [Bacteroidales bacterium]